MALASISSNVAVRSVPGISIPEHLSCTAAPAALWWQHQVVVNYDEADTDKFIELADHIEDSVPGIEVQGNPDGAAPAGAFTVSQESGTVLFERSSGAQYPDFDKLADTISKTVAAASGEPGVGCM